jgi:gliding motility-associated-like protein
LTVLTAGTYRLAWSETQGGCTKSDSVDITFKDVPTVNAGVDASICGTTTTLAATSSNMGTWTLGSAPAGGAAAFTNNVSTTSGVTVTTAGTYRLAWTSTLNGCPATDTVDVIFNAIPTANAGVDAAICGTTTTLSATSSVGSAGAWTVATTPAGGSATFTNATAANSGVNITTAGVYKLAWTATANGCPKSDTVDITFKDIPTANAGVDAIICGTTATLSATNSAGSTGAWTVASAPAGGSATFTNATATNSGVNITTAGVYKLIWTATANACPKADTVDITFNAIPTANAGVDAVICGTTTTLSATNSVGSTGAWTVASAPAGGSATFTNATAANSGVNITTAGVYKLAWTATANACPKADTVDITFNPIPTVNAGVDTTACGRNINLNANNNIGTGLWTISTQPTGGGAVFANSTTRNSGLTVLVAGTYRLIWTATAASCPKSDTVDVLFNNFPTVNAGVDSAICGRATLLNGSSTGTGAWSIVTAPGGGTAIFSNQSTVNSGINVTTGGTYSLAWTGTLTGCSKSDTVNLRFNDIPAVSNVRDNCSARNDSVVVQFNITGGTQPYTVFVGNTNTIAGTVTAGGLFVSNRRDTGVYQYTVRDANSCAPSQISGRQACRNCFTVAGDMDITPIKVCQGDSARGIYLGGYTRDTSNNDTIQYVLHRGDVRTQTLFRSRTPTFGFRAPMAYDSTYFISAVAGNDSSGNVAFSDPCLSISQSVPVTFHRNPTIVFGADTTVCGNGGCANLRFLMTGKPNFNVTINNGVSDTTLLNQPLGATFRVCPTANTTYRLVSIRDSNNCSNSVLADIMNVTVRRAAFAGRDTVPLNVCFGVDTIISLPTQLNGEDAGGRWTEYSSPTSTGGRFSAAAATFRTLGQAVNTYKFRYVVTGTAPCPNDTGDVVINLLAKPIADAGVDDTLNCTNISTGVQIGGINTSTGNVTYSWQGTNSNSPRPIANNPGTYTLTVTGQYCSASDSVVISIDTVSPIARIVADRNVVNCRFDTARLGGSTSTPIGRLSYDWALGANVFDNNPLTSVTQGGFYALIVTDTRNGCIDVDTVTVNADRVRPLVRIARPPVLNCRDSSIVIDGSASSSGFGRYTYAWSTTNGIFVSRRDTITPRVRQEGDYRFVIRDTVNFCSDSANTVVRRDTVKPRAFARAQDTLTCLNQTVNLTGSGSSIGLGVSYLWTTRDGQIVSGAQSLVPIVDEAGRYLLTVSNANNGCFDTASITVVRNTSRPNGLNLTVQQPKCYGGCDGTIRVDSVIGGTGPYIFSIDGKVYTAVRNLRNICAGSYRFYVQDASGCNWDTTFSIRQNTQLAVSLGGDTTIVLGDSLRIRVLTPDTALIRRITWTPIVDSAARRSTRAFSQIARPLVQTQFKVTIVDSLGCSATSTMTVFINKDRPLFTPNIFSPNGDGYNDKWVISGSQVVKSIKRLEIFDRWGSRVFAAQSFKPDDPNFGWDGNFDGKPLNPAVFTFWFEVEYQDGQTEIIEGDLTLMR